MYNIRLCKSPKKWLAILWYLPQPSDSIRLRLKEERRGIKRYKNIENKKGASDRWIAGILSLSDHPLEYQWLPWQLIYTMQDIAAPWTVAYCRIMHCYFKYKF